MKIQTLVVCLAIFLVGCGSGSSGSSANNVMMQAGQWEYVVVPENGTIPMFIDVNLPATNGELAGTNAQIYQPSENGIPTQSGPIYCGDFNLNGNISGSNLSVKMNWGSPASQFANFSGELAADGKSISTGKYSGEVCLLATGPGVGGHQIRGTVTGYTIAPANGTFTGTLDSSLYGADVVTISIKQNSDFSLNVTGTSVANGVTTALVPSGSAQSNVVFGATVYLTGSAQNGNGSEPFTIAAHLNPEATQLTITTMSFGASENVTGALTKQ